MSKLIKLVLLLGLALPCFGQDPAPPYNPGGNTGPLQYVQTAPSGACGYYPAAEVLMLTGQIYTCANRVWVPAPAPTTSGGVVYVQSAPNGACQANPPIQVVASTGAPYTCNNGTWGTPVGPPQVQYVPTAPSGACGATLPIQVVISTGILYTCSNGTWAAITGTAGNPGGSNTNVQFNGAGVFGGDSTFTFNTTTKNMEAKAVSGTSHSEVYPGVFEARVNACVQDAIHRTNGNASGECDLRGDAGFPTTTSQIVLGDASFDPVVVLLPCDSTWFSNINDTTTAIVLQYGGAVAIDDCGGSGNQLQITPNNGMHPGYVWEIYGGNSGAYIYDHGFQITNISGGGSTGSGIGFYIDGLFADGSSIDMINVFDSLDTYGEEVYGTCCGFNQTRSSINSDNGAGTPLFVYSDGSLITEGFTFRDGTIVHPGAGKPVFGCYDSTNYGLSNVTLDNVYTETNSSGNAAPLYQMTGCGKVSASHIQLAQYNSVNSPAFYVGTALANTFLTVDDVHFQFGTAAWTFPAETIENTETGQALYSDSQVNGNGFFNHYSVPSATTTLGPLINIGDIPYSGTGGAIQRLGGNTAALDKVMVSRGTQNTPAPTTKTCSNFASTISVTCTWSTSPAAGEYVVVGLINSAGSASFVSVTDSAGNTYTPIGTAFNPSNLGGSASMQQYYFGPLLAPITTTTATATSGSGFVIQADTTTNMGAVDGTCTANSTSGTSVSCSSAITTTGANDYIFCDAHLGVADTLTPGSGFTAGASAATGNLAQYEVQAAVGATTPAITISGSTPLGMTCTAFKAFGTSSAPTLTNTPTLALNLYTVSSGTGNPALPAASSLPAGTQVGITDCTSYTPGALCTGGGADFMMGITNGSAWTVH